MTALDAAIALASAGLPVFPCGRDKRPTIPTDKGGHGFHDATTDPDELRRLFAWPGSILIGCPTGERSGFDVLDLDYKHRAHEWEAANAHRLPETRVHATMSGGRHYLFRHVHGVRNSAGRISLGVDVRGTGGYVIVPPSNGYDVIHDAEIAEWPDWLLAPGLVLPEEKAASVNGHAPREPISDRRMEALVKVSLVAVANAGDGQKHFTLRNHARRLGGLLHYGKFSRSDAIEWLMAALPSTAVDRALARSTVEWGLDSGSADEIELTDSPAWEARQKANGHDQEPPDYDAPPPTDEDLEAYQGGAADRQMRQPSATRPTQTRLIPAYFNDIEANLNAADFVEGLLIEGGMSVIYGESNSGKTFFATDLAINIARGTAWRGREVERSAVIYCALEGAHGISNRIAAYREHHHVPRDVFIPFAVVTTSINLREAAADLPHLVTLIRQEAERMDLPVRLIVFDTLARAMAGGNENASEDMGALVINSDHIRRETKAHVCFIHHSGKDSARGARGHSSLLAAADTEIEVTNDDGARIARVTKQREMECSGEFSFSLHVVTLGENRRGKPVTSCVVVTEAEPEGQNGPRRKPRLIGHNKKAFEVLINLLASDGKAGFGSAPDGVPSVPENWWRERFYSDAMPGAEQEAKKRAFRRAADALTEGGVVGMAGERVWAI